MLRHGQALGRGRGLMTAAADHARQLGPVRLSLNTDVQNLPAQALYESMGWARDQKYHAYHLSLNA